MINVIYPNKYEYVYNNIKAHMRLVFHNSLHEFPISA